MPWTPEDAKHHSMKANPDKWAKMANAILSKYGDDGKAIRIANAKAKKKSPSKGTKRK